MTTYFKAPDKYSDITYTHLHFNSAGEVVNTLQQRYKPEDRRQLNIELFNGISKVVIKDHLGDVVSIWKRGIDIAPENPFIMQNEFYCAESHFTNAQKKAYEKAPEWYIDKDGYCVDSANTLEEAIKKADKLRSEKQHCICSIYSKLFGVSEDGTGGGRHCAIFKQGKWVNSRLLPQFHEVKTDSDF